MVVDKRQEDDMATAYEAMQSISKALVQEAARVGREEHAKLGRELTVSEVQNLAAMVQRQFDAALVIARMSK